jgi:anti-anti-sigma regulatory factor
MIGKLFGSQEDTYTHGERLTANLRWLIIGYLVLLNNFELALVPPTFHLLELTPSTWIINAVAALAALTNLSIVWRLGRGFRPSRTFCHGSTAFDVAIVSVGVYFSGGFGSPYLILYFLILLTATLRFGLRDSLFFALFTAGVYALVVLLVPEGWLGAFGNRGFLATQKILLARLCILFAVTYVGGLLAERERVQGQRYENEARRLSVINEITRTMSSTLDITQVLQGIVGEIGKVVGFDRGYIALVEEGRVPKVYVLSADGTITSGEGEEWRTISLAGWERGPQVFSDLGEGDSSGTELSVAQGMRSSIRLPLVFKDRPVGVLQLYSQRPDCYSEEDAAILEQIASQTAITIENARLFEQTSQALADLQAVSELRVDLQEGLISAQQEVILSLATPIVPVLEGIIVMPLVGNIDSQRARQIEDSLLKAIESQEPQVVIIDITGVPEVNTEVANHLLQAVQAVRLLGAQCILVGIGPVVAQAIVELGVDLSGVITHSDLQGGIEYALQAQGRETPVPLHAGRSPQ